MQNGITASGAGALSAASDDAALDAESQAVAEEELEAARQAKQDLEAQLDTLRDVLQTSRQAPRPDKSRPSAARSTLPSP
jgi:ABC-type Na+ efflux pump permease subunit